MSYEGQSHHPHELGKSPNSHLIGKQRENDNNNEPYIPIGLELIQAHWFIRHGERAPVRKRLTGLAGLPAIFPLCAVGKEFSQAVLTLPSTSITNSEITSTIKTTTTTTKDESFGKGLVINEGKKVVRGRMEVRRLEGTQGEGNLPVIGSPADCYWGELTDLGRQSTLSLGCALRKLYIEELKFLPNILPDSPLGKNPLAFRSTPMPRTIETLHQIVEGLFPGPERKEGKVEYTVRNPFDESLYPNSLCLRMRKLDRISADQAAKEHNASLEPLDSLIGKYINGPIRIDGHPRANGILDTIIVARSHGVKVPKEFERIDVLETLEKAVVHEWFDGYKNLEYSKLSMGRLLGDLGAVLEEKMKDPQEKENKLRLAVYACHDTSLGGILNSLEAFDKRWPPFTSSISFELFRPLSPPLPPPTFLSSLLPAFLSTSNPSPKPKDHYIRIRYNNKNLTIPACKEMGKHLEGSEGEVCTWEAFREAVKRVEITGADWEKGCAV